GGWGWGAGISGGDGDEGVVDGSERRDAREQRVRVLDGRELARRHEAARLRDGERGNLGHSSASGTAEKRAAGSVVAEYFSGNAPIGRRPRTKAAVVRSGGRPVGRD